MDLKKAIKFLQKRFPKYINNFKLHGSHRRGLNHLYSDVDFVYLYKGLMEDAAKILDNGLKGSDYKRFKPDAFKIYFEPNSFIKFMDIILLERDNYGPIIAREDEIVKNMDKKKYINNAIKIHERYLNGEITLGEFKQMMKNHKKMFIDNFYL